MATFSNCNGCMLGEHSKHSKHAAHWGVRSFEIIDGEFCNCPGDCAERGQAFFDNMLKQVSKEVLSPEANDLLTAIHSSNGATRDAAVKRINALMEADPLQPIRDAAASEGNKA